MLFLQLNHQFLPPNIGPIKLNNGNVKNPNIINNIIIPNPLVNPLLNFF